MATFNDIRTILRDFFVSSSGLDTGKVIWKDQTAPRPEKPYAALRTPKNLQRFGLSDGREMPVVGCISEAERISGQRRLVLNTEIYGVEDDFGDTPMDLMTAVQNSLQKESVRSTLKRRQETTISVGSPVNPAEVYQIDIDCEPITVEAESYLSLDGNGYAKGSASGIFNTDFNVYKTRFKPGFALTDGFTHYIFDTTAGSRYAINKGADSILYVRAGNTVVFFVLLANYSSFWNNLDWNELIITVDKNGTNHKAELNGNSLTLTSPSSFIPASPAEISVGARFGLETWIGEIDYLRIYAGATEAAALDNLTAGYEFSNDYTGTPAATLTPQGTGNTFTTDNTPEDIRDDLVTAINDNQFLESRIVAEDGAASNELIIKGSVGNDILIEIQAGNLTVDSQINAVDLAYIEDLGIVDVSALLTTEWEPRVQMDIVFNSHSTIFDDVGSIEEVEITDLDTNETFIVGD